MFFEDSFIKEEPNIFDLYYNYNDSMNYETQNINNDIDFIPKFNNDSHFLNINNSIKTNTSDYNFIKEENYEYYEKDTNENNKEKKKNKENEFIKREINNNDKELNTENKNIELKDENLKINNSLKSNIPTSIKLNNELNQLNFSSTNNIFKINKNKGKYKILSLEIKKQIYKDIEHLSSKEIAEKYNISIRNISRWKKEGIERKKGSGRKYKDPELEHKILNWYFQNDSSKITSKMFRDKAKELCSNSTFKASTGWLVRVQKKYNLTFAKY